MTDVAVGLETAPVESSAEVFHRHFPSGRVGTYPLDQVPTPALEKFEGYSRRFIEKSEYFPGNFDAVFRVNHEDGTNTYVAKQEKSYKERNKLIAEDSTYLIDLDQSGVIVGWGEIRKSLTDQGDYFKDKPFVGYTYTETEHRGKGLGQRRIIMMNAISQMLYHFPLNSDTTLSSDAARVWEGLVATGKAKRYMQGESQRFVFIPQ